MDLKPASSTAVQIQRLLCQSKRDSQAFGYSQNGQAVLDIVTTWNGKGDLTHRLTIFPIPISACAVFQYHRLGLKVSLRAETVEEYVGSVR